MKTIGAKELRLNLDKILDAVLNGEDIVVKHRFKAPVRLSAERPSDAGKTLAGLKALDEARKTLKKPFPYDKNKPLKEIYRELLEEKYGQ